MHTKIYPGQLYKEYIFQSIFNEILSCEGTVHAELMLSEILSNNDVQWGKLISVKMEGTSFICSQDFEYTK